MITALLGIFIAQLAGITGLRLWNHRAQRTAELRRWAPFRQNPIIDPVLRKYSGGKSTDRKTRWAANHFKTTVRNFVNSEAFSITVDGLTNTDSSFWNLGRKFKTFQMKTKLGGLQPAEPSVCTIL
jgi:hypothetical protein